MDRGRETTSEPVFLWHLNVGLKEVHELRTSFNHDLPDFVSIRLLSGNRHIVPFGYLFPYGYCEPRQGRLCLSRYGNLQFIIFPFPSWATKA
ncbi:MAG: hypothetical protein ACOYKC_04745 [Anaerolineaceae bacterium]